MIIIACVSDNKRKKTWWNKETLGVAKMLFTKNSNDSYFPIGSSCQPWLVQANFLLVAWNGSMLLFWSRSGKETRSLFAFPLKGRDSLLLFWLALLYSPFYLDKIILSPNLSSLFSLDKNILSPTSILQNYSKTIPNSVLVAKLFQFYKKNSNTIQILS